MLRNPPARAVLVVTLAGALSSGCSVGSCNCPSSGGAIILVPASLDVQVTASGEGCPGPVSCGAFTDGGACTQWNLPLTHTGNCTVSAQAADGQHATVSVNVRTEDRGCCGTAYTTDPPGALASFPKFSLADAGTSD